MGNHYTPKRYLRQFANVDGGLWLHDGKTLRSRLTTVDGIGHEGGLYSPKVEHDLNIQVETPTHSVFDKILSKKPISSSDRSALAKYIVVMWKRVPSGRERARQRFPSVVADVKGRIMSELDKLKELDPTFESWGELARGRASAYLEKVKDAPPSNLWYESINLTDEGPLERALLSMNWVFLHSEKLQYLTSDNPVFFFEHEGIGRSSSELTFPVSSSIALWATRRDIKDGSHVIALPVAIRQINRRTAYNSKRFIVSRDNEAWIMPFIKKGEWQLERLGW